jgi:hypothetical protein
MAEKREPIDLEARFYIIEEAVGNPKYLPREIVEGVLWALDKCNQEGSEIVPKKNVIERSFDRIVNSLNFYGSTEKVHPYIRKTLEYFASKEIISSNNGDLVFPLKYEKYIKNLGNGEKK